MIIKFGDFKEGETIKIEGEEYLIYKTQIGNSKKLRINLKMCKHLKGYSPREYWEKCLKINEIKPIRASQGHDNLSVNDNLSGETR
jgi:hypothetical protein